MIACFLFLHKISDYPRLSQLLQNEFQSNLIVFENERTIFVYNISENAAQHTLFILEIAHVQVSFGMGKSKQEALNRAKVHMKKVQMNQQKRKKTLMIT